MSGPGKGGLGGGFKFSMKVGTSAQSTQKQTNALLMQRRVRLDDGPDPKDVDKLGSTGKWKPKKRDRGTTDKAAYHRDVAELPEPSFGVNVDSFGAAYMRQLGWNDGEKIGKNGLETPVKYLARDKLLGLGADPAAPPAHAKKRERRQHEEQKIAAPKADGTRRHIVSIDEKLVTRKQLERSKQTGSNVFAVNSSDSEDDDVPGKKRRINTEKQMVTSWSAGD